MLIAIIPRAMPWAKSFWAFSPYLNHMRNFSYFITCCYVRNVGTKILLFLHLYEPKPKRIVSAKEYKSTPEMVAHQKKTLFERKALQNPPIDKKKLPNRRKTKGNIKINAKIFGGTK